MLYLEWSAPDLTVIVCRSLCLQCVRRGIYCISDPCLLCVRPHSHGLYQPVSAVCQTSQSWSVPTLVYCVSDLTVIICTNLCLLCVRPHSHGLYQPVSAVYQTSQSWSVPTLVYCVSDLTVIICTNLCLQCVRPHSNFTNLCLLCVRRHSNCLYQPVSAVCQTSQQLSVPTCICSVSDLTVIVCTNLCLQCQTSQ